MFGAGILQCGRILPQPQRGSSACDCAASDYQDQRRLLAADVTGGRHPITQLSDLEEKKKIWAAFPLEARQFNDPFGKGQILVSTKEGKVPLLGTKRIGEGRVVSIFSDDIWRWNFGMVAAEKTNRLYIRLVAQMIRWLSGDPGSSQVQIIPEAEQAKDGTYVLRMQ